MTATISIKYYLAGLLKQNVPELRNEHGKRKIIILIVLCDPVPHAIF
ncbi:MAG: hypothetical protein WC015_03665 [Methanoregula sp.]